MVGVIASQEKNFTLALELFKEAILIKSDGNRPLEPRALEVEFFSN